MKNALLRPFVISEPTKAASAAGSKRAISPGTTPQAPKTKRVYRNTDSGLFSRKLDFDTIDITKVQIMYMSQEELEKIAIPIMNEEKSGMIQGTIRDPRMYPADKDKECGSCKLSQNYCPGHLGRIDLVEPIINFLAYENVIHVLQSICHKCATLLIQPEYVVKDYPSGTDRLRKIAAASIKKSCRNVKCKYYRAFNPKLSTKMGSMTGVDTEINGVTGPKLMALKIVKIFNAISEKDLEAIGFKRSKFSKPHPSNFIFQSLPVIPEGNRPTSIINGVPKTDPLTTLYKKIVGINNSLKAIKLSGGNTIGEIGKKKGAVSSYDLDNNICALFAGDDEKSGLQSNQNMNNIKNRLSKKKGYLRSNAMGKRSNHTGRTMLGPASLPFGFVRIPAEMAKISITERVCSKNITYLQSIYNKDKVNRIITPTGMRYHPAHRPDRRLEIGDLVVRILETGDPVMFNRQPTLHKQSIMGYLAKIESGRSIGIHSSNTTPHNADFDGDEGNIYGIPDYESRAEIIHLAGCWNNIIGAQFSRPVMGIVYNGLTSAFLMTQQLSNFSDSDWLEAMAIFDRFPDRINGTPGYPGLLSRAYKHYGEDQIKSGPVLFSSTLPPDFYYDRNGVTIVEGILIDGIIGKKHIGPSTGSIVHHLFHQYGTDVVTRFITEAQYLLDWYIEFRGFTIGYTDCSLSGEQETQIRRIIDEETEKALKKIEDLGPITPMMSKFERDFHEESLQTALDNVKHIGNQIIKDAVVDSNALKVMAISGAKGKDENVAQITGIIGQQFIDDLRPIVLMNISKSGHNRRFLSYYDLDPVSGRSDIMNHGFIDKSFGDGMRPGQMFTHMMTSRVGLIDTALGTAKTGYVHRTISKTLEDVRLGYNGTVCRENGNIIQYMAGPDSYDSRHLIKTNSSRTGVMWSPMDIESIISKINTEVEMR